jgi:hypothetical protein
MEALHDNQALQQGNTMVYLGVGILKHIPVFASTEALILALNEGRAMVPKQMRELSVAAMSIEQRRGRRYIEERCMELFFQDFSHGPVHAWLQKTKPMVVIDTNRDTVILKLYQDARHFLLKGFSRIDATSKRFALYVWDGASYVETKTWDGSAPLIYKPMGCPVPSPNFVISDADYVDWLTEAMGGFAFPEWFKAYRKDKHVLYLGESFAKDTQRMVAREITQGAQGGVYVQEAVLDKAQKRFIKEQGLAVVPQSAEIYLKG